MTWQEPAPYADGLGRLLSPGFDGTNGTTPHDGRGAPWQERASCGLDEWK